MITLNQEYEMETYDVTITATIVARNIGAESKEEAEETAMEMLANGDIDEGNAEYEFEGKKK